MNNFKITLYELVEQEKMNETECNSYNKSKRQREID